MKSIAFSKEYHKLWGQHTAELIGVRLFPHEDVTPDLIEYDTKAKDGSYYPLPDSMMLQLIFLGDKGIPFCTLRRHTPYKEAYYRASISEEFIIARTGGGTPA